MKLRFNDVDTASKYYVQIAESEAGLATAPVRETTENKVYTFQNAKLATKYYYRAATSEEGLAAAEVKNITSTDQAPRVVYVPDVLNFRDIGGWESTLVPGAKINQGLYFRCAQLDAAQGSTTSKLDTAGKGLAALKELGIKCDIDMRDIGNQIVALVHLKLTPLIGHSPLFPLLFHPVPNQSVGKVAHLMAQILLNNM